MCCSGSYACEYRHKVKHGCFNFLVDKEEEERGAGEESCGYSPQKCFTKPGKNKAKWYLKYICTWVWMENLD